MTNLEAIGILEVLSISRRRFSDSLSEDIRDALALAIKTLKRESAKTQPSLKLDQSVSIDREPCETCDSCASCIHSIEAKIDIRSPCFWCNSYNHYMPRNFCPNCGRPLTEKARKLLKGRRKGG